MSTSLLMLALLGLACGFAPAAHALPARTERTTCAPAPLDDFGTMRNGRHSEDAASTYTYIGANGCRYCPLKTFIDERQERDCKVFKSAEFEGTGKFSMSGLTYMECAEKCDAQRASCVGIEYYDYCDNRGKHISTCELMQPLPKGKNPSTEVRRPNAVRRGSPSKTKCYARTETFKESTTTFKESTTTFTESTTTREPTITTTGEPEPSPSPEPEPSPSPEPEPSPSQEQEPTTTITTTTTAAESTTTTTAEPTTPEWECPAGGACDSTYIYKGPGGCRAKVATVRHKNGITLESQASAADSSGDYNGPVRIGDEPPQWASDQTPKLLQYRNQVNNMWTLKRIKTLKTFAVTNVTECHSKCNNYRYGGSNSDGDYACTGVEYTRHKHFNCALQRGRNVEGTDPEATETNSDVTCYQRSWQHKCGVDHCVANGQCTRCPGGKSRKAGDDPANPDNCYLCI